MSHNRIFKLLTGVLCTVMLGQVGCGDDETGSTDTVSEPATLSEDLSSAGLAAGTWAVGNNGAPVCTATFSYPGSPPVTESVDLSGFQTFELIIDDEEETIVIRGQFDDLSARWRDDCIRFEGGTDSIENHSGCGEDVCTPFSEVRLCVEEGDTTFFAQVPDCGHNTFPIAQQ